jgi:hypothetical protein
MVQQTLVAYIIAQRQAGHQFEEINQFLIQSGYDRAEVESSIQYVINLQANPQIAANQRIQQLATYIQQQTTAGYPIETVKTFLVGRGYPYYEVDSAINLIQAPQKEVKTEHKLVIFALITMIILAGAMSFFYFKIFSLVATPPEATALLDVKVTRLTNIPIPGEDFTFTTDVINLGRPEPYDITMRYRVIDKTNDQTVLEQQESIAISTTTQRVVTFPIPDDIKPGNYILRADALYGNYSATAGFIFTIQPKEIAKKQLEEIKKKVPITEENKTNQTETGTQPPITLPLKPLTPIVAEAKPKKPFEGYTKQQAFEMVKKVAANEPARAAELCKTFDFESNIEQCLTTIASYKKDANYCSLINRTRGADACYMQIVVETGDTTPCSKITDQNIVGTCKLMSLAKTLQTAQPGQSVDLYSMMGGVGVSNLEPEALTETQPQNQTEIPMTGQQNTTTTENLTETATT